MRSHVPALTAVLVVAHAAPAHADIRLAMEGCDLDGDRVRELLRLEVSDVFAETDPVLEVALECNEDGSVATIRVRDPLTAKEVARRTPMAGLDTEARERAVALAAGQLVLTSWLELLLPARRSRPTFGRYPAAEARARARAREATTPPPEPPPPWSAWISLSAAGRLRQMPQPFGTLGAELRLGLRWRALGFHALGAFEWGRAQRSLGVVDLRLGGLGLGFRATPKPPWRLGATLLVGTQRFAGRAERDDVREGARRSPQLEVRASVGLGFPRRTRVLGLDLEVGFTALTPDALVSGERAVSAGGFFVGLRLEVGAALSTRPSQSSASAAIRSRWMPSG